MADFSSNITVVLGNDSDVIGSAAPTDSVTVGAVKESGQTGLYINTDKAYTAWFKNSDGTWTSVKAFSSSNFPTSFTFAWGSYTAFYMQTSEDSHVAYLYPRTGPLYIDSDLSDDTNSPDSVVTGGDMVYTVYGSIAGGAVAVLEGVDSSLQTRLSTEEATRSTADNSLTARVSTEEATRGTAASSLTTRISTEEVNRATADSSLADVDTGLSNSINSLSTRIGTEETASSSLSTRVSTEETARANADSSLTTRVSTEEVNRSTAVSSLADVDTGLSNSVSSLSTRIGAEEGSSSSLTTRISSEEVTRANADSSLATRIGAEETASSSLSTRIAAEESVRASADTSLTTRLSSEEATRSAADSTLTAAAGSLTTRVAAEESARASVDTLISAAVSTEKARVDAILASADADKDTFVEVVSLINAVDTDGDNAVASVVSNLNAEISATNADISSLDTALSGEASSRSTADSSLATSISGEASSRASDVSSIETVISALQSDVNKNEADSDNGISSEQGSRIAGDSSLTTRVSTEEAARATADSSLATAFASADTSLTTRVSTEEAARGTADSSLATAFASADTSLATSLATSLTTTAVTISGSSDIPFAIYNAGDTSPLFMVDSSSSWDGAPRVTIRQANDHGQEDTAFPATANTDAAVRGVFHVEREMSEDDYDSSTEENMPLISAFAIGDGTSGGSSATGGDAIVRLVSWGGDSKIQLYASADTYDATAIGGKRPLSGQTLGAIEMGGYATNQGPLPAAWMRVVAAETWSYTNTNGTIFQFRSTREGSGNGYSQGGIDHIVQMSHNRGFNAIAPPVAYADTSSMLVLNANQTNDGWASYMFAADHSNGRMVMYVKEPDTTIQTISLPYSIGDDVQTLNSELSTLSGSVSTNASNISSNSTTIASNEGIIGDIRDAVNAAANGDDLLTRLQAISWPT